MFRKFRKVEAVFCEPSLLGAVTLLGHIKLKQGALLLGPSSVVMEGPGGNAPQNYTLKFAVSEPTDDFDSVEHAVQLVSDLESFEHAGEAIHLCNLRGLGNCGGRIFLVSPDEHPLGHVPDLSGNEVISRLAPTH